MTYLNEQSYTLFNNESLSFFNTNLTLISIQRGIHPLAIYKLAASFFLFKLHTMGQQNGW